MDNKIIIIVLIIYLCLSTSIALWQSRKIRNAKQLRVSRLSVWQAATFLTGFTLGGAGTYGVAGDTVKFGMTYLVWFPLSVVFGWWVTGWLFAKAYYHRGGETIPSILSSRFDHRTSVASSISSMLYAFFVMLLEIYTLAIIIRTILPEMTMPQAAFISLVVNVASVAFSGILGSATANVLHSGAMLVSFSIAAVLLWRAVGGWHAAVNEVIAHFSSFAYGGISRSAWLSAFGMGWGIIGQILVGKAGRLGGISVVSNIAASCKSENDAVSAFWLAGILSGLPPLLSSAIGVFAAALLGNHMSDTPFYSMMSMAVAEISPLAAGFLLAAVTGAIISAFGPVAIVFSSVLIEDILKPAFRIPETLERILFPGIIIIMSIISAVYAVLHGIQDLLPFLYTTAFPCTVPITVVTFFGLFSSKSSNQSAFLSIIIGVAAAIIWGNGLHNPWGVPNMLIALLIPFLIMTLDLLIQTRMIKKNG